MLDIDQLKAFILVANTKSFTRAAELLNVVQSTVSSRIQSLEKQLGKELFERDKRNIRLTDAGLTFLPYSERILELTKEGVKSVQLEKNFNRQLTIGTTHALWDYVLFDGVNTFQLTYIDTPLSLITEHSNIIIRKMIDGLIDIGIVFYPVHHGDISLELIIEDSFVLVTDPSIDLSNQLLTPESLRNFPYIHLNWGGSFSKWFRQSFHDQKVFPLEVDHVSLLLKFLKNRIGFGFLPYSVAKGLIQQGTIINVPFHTETPVPERPIYLLTRKRSKPTKNLDILTGYIKRSF
jgi:DNA-binding transcriptional LysR family regulator